MMQCAYDDPFSFRAFSLDATVFEDNGTWYYIWAEKVGVGKQISNLYIAKMESATKLATVQVLLTTPDYDWERHGFWVNEGPGIIRRGDKIYLTFSASETGIYYCVGMLTATSGTDLLDPLNWKKDRFPVFAHQRTFFAYDITFLAHDGAVFFSHLDDRVIFSFRDRPDIRLTFQSLCRIRVAVKTEIIIFNICALVQKDVILYNIFDIVLFTDLLHLFISYLFIVRILYDDPVI